MVLKYYPEFCIFFCYLPVPFTTIYIAFKFSLILYYFKPVIMSSTHLPEIPKCFQKATFPSRTLRCFLAPPPKLCTVIGHLHRQLVLFCVFPGDWNHTPWSISWPQHYQDSHPIETITQIYLSVSYRKKNSRVHCTGTFFKSINKTLVTGPIASRTPTDIEMAPPLKIKLHHKSISRTPRS